MYSVGSSVFGVHPQTNTESTTHIKNSTYSFFFNCNSLPGVSEVLCKLINYFFILIFIFFDQLVIGLLPSESLTRK